MMGGLYKDIRVLLVWTLGSEIQVIQQIWKLRKPYLFWTFQSFGSWPIESRVIAGFFQSFGTLGSLVFHLFPVLISFGYTTQNSMSVEFWHKGKWEKSEAYNYVIKRTTGSCKWLLLLVTHWMDQLDHQNSFVVVSISRITWTNGYLSKQIAANKCQTCRMKVLSLILVISYRWRYFAVSDLVRFWCRFWWER